MEIVRRCDEYHLNLRVRKHGAVICCGLLEPKFAAEVASTRAAGAGDCFKSGDGLLQVRQDKALCEIPRADDADDRPSVVLYVRCVLKRYCPLNLRSGGLLLIALRFTVIE